MAHKTRDRLIEVARQLFVHKGLQNTTMNDIANASEKGRRTVYTYFKSKREIYAAVLENESDNMVKAMKEIVDSPMTPDCKLRAFLKVRLEQGDDSGVSGSAIKSLFRFDLHRAERLRKRVMHKESKLLMQILKEGIDAGIFDSRRADILRHFLILSANGIDLAELKNESPESQSLIQNSFIEFVISDLTNNRLT